MRRPLSQGTELALARIARNERRASRRAWRDRTLAALTIFCVWGCGSSDPFKGCGDFGKGCNNAGCNDSGCNNSGCNNTWGCNNPNNGCGHSESTSSGALPGAPTDGSGPKPIAPTRPSGAPSGTNEDEFEPNESVSQAAQLDEESDEQTSDAYFLTLHDPSDIDFFKFHVVDQGVDGNPSITIALDSPRDLVDEQFPAMLVTYECDSTHLSTTVSCDDSSSTCGVDATGYAYTFSTQCKSNDDSVTVLLEIAAIDGKTHDYSLQIFVD
jgi:hypothetical protein